MMTYADLLLWCTGWLVGTLIGVVCIYVFVRVVDSRQARREEKDHRAAIERMRVVPFTTDHRE